MSDETSQTPRLPRVPNKIRFIVDCDMEKGEVQIQGPIQQKLLAVKILSDAIHIVCDYKIPVIVDPKKMNGAPMDIRIQ